MYVVRKTDKYFTGVTTEREIVELLWTRCLSNAKIWKEKRAWAQKAADRWGGEVVEVDDYQIGRIIKRD